MKKKNQWLRWRHAIETGNGKRRRKMYRRNNEMKVAWQWARRSVSKAKQWRENEIIGSWRRKAIWRRKISNEMKSKNNGGEIWQIMAAKAACDNAAKWR
jgi:hypothetical protein